MPPVKVAVVTQDVIGERLAGPAIRALAMGRALTAAGHEARVCSTGGASSAEAWVAPGRLSPAEATELGRWADVVVVQGDVLDARPGLGRGQGALVGDLYDPFELEGLVRGVDLPVRARYSATRRALHVLSGQLQRGDFFLCASERQRLFWLGHLDAAGRVNPATHDADPTLANLLAIAPFGIEEAPPTRDGVGLRGRIPGIDDASRILLWGGGIYDWLDPLPLIEAVATLLPELPDLRLVFMGTAHPNPAVPAPAMLERARALVERLDIAHAVVFHAGWVPYEERHNVLLDAEIGVSGHLPHVETALAFRTRILDYIWTGLPILTTAGDALGDLVESAGLGVVVPPGDPAAVADGLRSLLLDPARAAAARRAIGGIAPTMRWSVALRPLLDFCADPRPAADRAVAEAVRLRRDRAPGGNERVARVRDVTSSVQQALRDGGVGGVVDKVRTRVARRRSS
jgi:hypothetical protein